MKAQRSDVIWPRLHREFVAELAADLHQATRPASPILHLVSWLLDQTLGYQTSVVAGPNPLINVSTLKSQPVALCSTTLNCAWVCWLIFLMQ